LYQGDYVKITVNGEEKEYAEGTSLALLINDLGIKVKVMAAAVNMNVVKKDDWESHMLQEGDKVELLHFVGGG
jgi:sulfur carrier protein